MSENNEIDYRQYKLGVLPSPVDERDYAVGTILQKVADQPSQFELKDELGVLDQGQYSSCVAFSSSEGLSILASNVYGKLMSFSQGFIYGNRPGILQYKGEGMIPRECLQNLVDYGDCLFEDMSINDTYPNCKAYISNHADLMQKASQYKLPAYAKANTVDDIKTALLAGHPTMAVINVYSSFYYIPSDGIAPDYKQGEILYGGHATEIIGYDDSKQAFKVKNSWGKNWNGIYNGYYYLKYNNNIATEYWTMIWDKPQPKPQPVTYYKVQVSACLFKSNAQKIVDNLKTANIASCIVKEGLFYKVQCGVFLSTENRDAMCTKLQKLGYKPYVKTITK